MTTVNARAHRRLMPGLLFAAAMSAPAAAFAAEDEVAALATCAAYFFNATNVRPMIEYDALYSAGERALNEASRHRARDEVERLMADASIEMRALTDGDWTRFDRVVERYAAGCADLLALPAH